MLQQLQNLASQDITERPPRTFTRSIFKFCEQNFRDLEVNHEIHENIVPQKFGAIGKFNRTLCFSFNFLFVHIERAWGKRL